MSTRHRLNVCWSNAAAVALVTLSALAAPAAAETYEDEPAPAYARPPRQKEDALTVALTVAPTPSRVSAPRADWRPPDHLAGRWRLACGIGARFGSFLLDNRGTGAVIPGHLDAGLRKGRAWIYAEYSLMSIALPAGAGAGGGAGLSGAGRGDDAGGDGARGLVHRLGAHARWSVARVGARDVGFDLYVEGGAGVQAIRWDAGGALSRPDLALGLGAAGWGAGSRTHGGFTAGLRIHLARRHDGGAGPVACDGPCDVATRPTAIDRSFLFDLTILLGR